MQKKGPNKIISENRLFWFLKEGTEINLQDKAQLDLYIQQILSCGKTEDVRTFWREYLESFV